MDGAALGLLNGGRGRREGLREGIEAKSTSTELTILGPDICFFLTCGGLSAAVLSSISG